MMMMMSMKGMRDVVRPLGFDTHGPVLTLDDGLVQEHPKIRPEFLHKTRGQATAIGVIFHELPKRPEAPAEMFQNTMHLHTPSHQHVVSLQHPFANVGILRAEEQVRHLVEVLEFQHHNALQRSRAPYKLSRQASGVDVRMPHRQS